MAEDLIENEQPTEHSWFSITAKRGQRTGIFAVKACSDSEASRIFNSWTFSPKNSFTRGDKHNLVLDEEEITISHLSQEEQRDQVANRVSYVIDDKNHPFPEVFDVIVLSWRVFRTEPVETVLPPQD